jgi:hypothetical protein
MWKERSEILAPLTKLTSTKNLWKWTDEQQNAFDTMKKIMARETILAYPNFEIPFEVHTDASAFQLGAVISQNGKPIAFYSGKLTHFTEALCSELYTFNDEDLPATAFPLSYVFLGKAQSRDVAILKETAKTKSLYSIQPFTEGGKTRELICYNSRIVIPKKLQARDIQWYHDYLGHPGINRTEETIGQHLW